MSAELDLTPLEEGNLTEDQRRLFAEVRLRLEAIEKENAAMKAHRRVGLVWETDSYKARFSDPVFGTDWEHGGIVLDQDPAVSRPEGDTGNLIIEGDNVDALRVLSRTHKGKFDCIFIDPPYNTESTTFVYNDKQIDKEDRLRYSVWIEGLHRRLRYVPDLLSDQGVLLVAINDKQRVYVEGVLNEILPGKRKGAIVWRSRTGKNEPGNANLSVNHEHILVYANDGFAFGGQIRDVSAYNMDDNDGRGPYTRGDLCKSHTYRERPLTYFPIQDPESGVWFPANPDTVWRFSTVANLKPGQKTRKDTMEMMIANGKIIFPKGRRVHTWNTREELDAAIAARDVPVNGKGVPLLRPDLPNLDFFVGKPVGWGIPAYKRHLAEVQQETRPLSSWASSGSEIAGEKEFDFITSGLATESEAHLKAIFGEKVFNYAKPVSLLMGLLRQSSQEDSLVLDFFGGSGTTAEAVLRLNAEDGGSRRFVMVSNTEHTAEEPEKNLCRDVLARRVGIVMDGFTKGKKEIEGTGGGFSYLRTARVDYDGVAAWHAYEMTPERVWTLICLLEGGGVTPLTLTDGFAMLRTEDRLTAFVPEWGAVDASALAAAFGEAPDAAHALFTDNPAAALRGLSNLGVSSVVAEDAWERAEAVCGPDL